MPPAHLSYALTAAFSWFRPTAGIEPPHAGQADAEFSFVPLPGDLAARAGKATARSTAKNTEYPPAHLQLAGSPWPWRPTLFALTIAAATAVALLPAAAARRHRP